MRKIFRNPWFWCAAVIAFVAVLGVLSSQNAEISNEKSLKIANGIYAALPGWMKSADAEADVKAVNLFIRKTAHFSIFAVITLMLLLASPILNMRTGLKYVLILALVLLIACSDEFHQYFSIGREASFTDVLIDVGGGVFVYLIIGLRRVLQKFAKVRKKHRKVVNHG